MSQAFFILFSGGFGF